MVPANSIATGYWGAPRLPRIAQIDRGVSKKVLPRVEQSDIVRLLNQPIRHRASLRWCALFALSYHVFGTDLSCRRCHQPTQGVNWLCFESLSRTLGPALPTELENHQTSEIRSGDSRGGSVSLVDRVR